MTSDGTPAEPLMMPKDEFKMVKWVFEVPAGPSFPADAEAACRLAAKLNWSGTGRVHALLAEAAGKARPAGDEAKLAALPDVLRHHYLAEIICSHERQADNPVCACSLVFLGWHPSVGKAVDAWVAHVLAIIGTGQEK